MEDINRLKAFPLFHFLHPIGKANRIVFGILYACIALLAVALVWVAWDPFAWVLEINPIPEEFTREVTIDKVHAFYRTFDLKMEAFGRAVTYGAGPMLPHAWMVVAFTLFQILGWSAGLAAATRITNWLCYPLYFIFSLEIFFSGWGDLLIPSVPMLGAAVFILAFLVPAWLFQQGMVRVSLVARAGIFMLMLTALYAFGGYRGGWQFWHAVSARSVLPLTLLSLFYLFFIGNDLAQLLLWVAVNRKEKNARMGKGFLLGAGGVLTLFLFLWMQEYAGFGLFPVSGLILRPAVLVAFVSLLTIGLKQNLYPRVSDVFGEAGAFHFLLAALAVLSLSTFVYHAGMGDILYLYLLERHASVFFFLFTPLFLLYVFFNFHPFIEQKVPFYFVSMLPKRLMYFFVILVVVMTALAIEAKDDLKSQRLYFSISGSRLGDVEAVSGNADDALTEYSLATLYAKGNQRAWYNSGTLLLPRAESRDSVVQAFRQATSWKPFPAAALNLGNVLRLQHNEDIACADLRDYYRQKPDAYLAANLAWMWCKRSNPDSAIFWYKEALKLSPSDPDMLSGLAMVYLRNGKGEESSRFLRAAMQAAKPSAAATACALLQNIEYGDSVPVPPQVWKSSQVANDLAVNFNLALQEFAGHNQEAGARLGHILEMNPDFPPALLLDGILKFRNGEVQNALSRMDYIRANWPPLKAWTHHFLAVEYFRAGVPEMAAEQFRQAAAGGIEADHLNAVRMEIDAGNHGEAQKQLNLVRVLFEKLWNESSKESAMLLKAYGQDALAYTDWDFSGITEDENVRIGKYAGQAGNTLVALEHFRKMTEADSATVLPYLEMGRIYNRLNDSLAIETLQEGLKRRSADNDIKEALGEALILHGRKSEGMKLLGETEAVKGESVVALREKIASGGTDSVSALKRLEDRVAAKPLDKEAILTLGETYRRLGRPVEGYKLFYDATQVNDRNADLWLGLAWFARELGELNQRDAGYAAIRAIEFTKDEKQKLKIAGEYSREIQVLKENP